MSDQDIKIGGKKPCGCEPDEACDCAAESSVAAPTGLADFVSDNMPMDAGARRAHFERSKDFNAFHDGLDTPEIREAIARARDKALKAIKSRKSANAESSHAGPVTPGLG